MQWELWSSSFEAANFRCHGCFFLLQLPLCSVAVTVDVVTMEGGRRDHEKKRHDNAHGKCAAAPCKMTGTKKAVFCAETVILEWSVHPKEPFPSQNGKWTASLWLCAQDQRPPLSWKREGKRKAVQATACGRGTGTSAGSEEVAIRLARAPAS